jgi:hypothetical protein
MAPSCYYTSYIFLKTSKLMSAMDEYYYAHEACVGAILSFLLFHESTNKLNLANLFQICSFRII